MQEFYNVIDYQSGKLLNNRYYIDVKLGEGSYGRVYKALDQRTKEVVAIKQYLIKTFIKQPKVQEFVNQEIKLLKQIKSKHVIRYIDDFYSCDSLFLVLEYCNQGDLDILQAKKKFKQENFSELEVISYFNQILSGLQEIHRNLGIHRDIKLDNILISQNCLKIGNLGFDKCLHDEKYINSRIVILGTKTNMAPEILEGKKYGMEVDVYSLGVLLYQLLYGESPYRNDDYQNLKNQIKIRIQKINYDKPGVKISSQMKDLLQKMICYDRRKRIRWDQIYDHPIFQFESSALSIVLPGSIAQLPDHKQEAKNLYQKLKNFMVTDENPELKEVFPDQGNLSTINEEANSTRSDDSKDYYQLKKNIEDQQLIANNIQNTKQKYEQYKQMLIQLYQTFKHNCQIVKTIRNRIIQLALAKKAYIMSSIISESLQKDQNYFQAENFKEFLQDPFYQSIKKELIQAEVDFKSLFQSCKQEIQQTLQNLLEEQQKKEKLIQIIIEEITLNITSNNFDNLIKLGFAYSYSNIVSDLNVLKTQPINQSVYYQSFILTHACLNQDDLFKIENFNLAYFICQIKQLSKSLNNRYYIDVKLGEGSYGRVYKAFDQRTKEVVAIKQYQIKTFIKQPKIQELVNQEIKLLKTIKSKHVIRYIDDFSNSDSLFLVLEYCNQGDLGTLQAKKKMKQENISELEVIGYFNQILRGLQEIHRNLGIHRDIKLDNILISQNCLKIGDLGFAKCLDDVKGVAKTILGTQTNMAPEILEGKPYGMEVDVYRIQEINYDKPGVKISSQMKDLLQKMICYDRRKRIRWDQLYDHPIFQFESSAQSIVLPGSIAQLPDHKQEAKNLYQKLKNFMVTDENPELKEVFPDQGNLSTINEEANSSRSDDSKDYYQLKKNIEDQQLIADNIQDTKQKYDQYKQMLIQLFQTFTHNCQIVKTIRNRIIQLALAKKAYIMSSNISESLKNDQNFFQAENFKEFLQDPFYQQIKKELIQAEVDFKRLFQSCKQEIQQTLQNLLQEQQKKEKLIKIINEEITLNITSNNFDNLIKLGFAYSYSKIVSDLNVLKTQPINQSVYYQSFILTHACLNQDHLFQTENFNLAYFICQIKQLSMEDSIKQYYEILEELKIKQIQL
ncbi:hypothetical protein ABPG74_006072 [Tetrahymena malaccensis]